MPMGGVQAIVGGGGVQASVGWGVQAIVALVGVSRQ